MGATAEEATYAAATRRSGSVIRRRARPILLVIGIFLVGAAMLLPWRLANQATEATRASLRQVAVVTATRDIPDRTHITGDFLTVRAFPADFAPAGALGSLDQAIGRFTRGVIARGQIISAGQLAPMPPSNAMGERLPIPDTQRLIVQTVQLALQVDNVPDVVAQARQLADSLGGFVVSAVQREENGRPAATVTIRVPAERLGEALDALKGLATSVSNEQLSANDVTEEFVDVDARLRNLTATESRYVELFQRAATVDEVLKVEQQLSTTRGQIEQFRGRLQLLERTALMTLITVELRPYAVSAPTADWSLVPVFGAAWAALITVVRQMLSALVWVLVFTPIWLPLGFLLWYWLRRRGRSRRHT